MKLFYCPTCTRVYYLPEDQMYICGRNHAASIWADGKKRRFVIEERSESNRPPWPIPPLVEEREMFNEDIVECWIDGCKNPGDTEFGDLRRHFGYGAFGGRHLSREEVAGKYKDFILQPAAV